MEPGTIALPPATHDTIRVNGADIYHEVRGQGPPVFFVQGTTGDGGSFEQVANLLADNFTVVTYHRRGNSWSPRPAGWTSTTVDEQADDLAALIQALGLAPATVFGTSDGASILVNLLIRHPATLRGAIVHEPLLEPLIPAESPARVALDQFSVTVESAFEAGGSAAGMEALIRAIVGDAAYDARDPVRRNRVLETADTYFEIEAEAFAGWMPDPDDLARVTTPMLVACGTTDILGGGFRQACEWIARLLGRTVQLVPGGHTPYLDRPAELVEAIRPFLDEVNAADLGTRRPLLYERTGKGDPIILEPGGLSGWYSWIPFVHDLAADREVIRVQHRGLELAGSGQPIPETWGIETESEALLATVDALGLERFDLAGWSLGGHVALDFALRQPERVRTLTLIEPATMWMLRPMGYPEDEVAALERFDRSMAGKSISSEDFKQFLVRVGLGAPGDDVESQPSWPIWMRNRQILASFGAIWEYRCDLRRLETLSIPVMVVHGTASTPHDIAIVREIARRAPKATLLELPGDHACHLQHPGPFLAAMAGLLASDVAPTGTGGSRETHANR